MSSPCRWMLKPSCLRRSADTDAKCERERLRQAQQLLGLDLVGSTGSQQCLQQPELQVGDAGGHLPGQEEMALRLRGPKNLPIHQGRDELLRRFLARCPVAPGRQHPSLHLGRGEVVLKGQQTTDDLGECHGRTGTPAPSCPNAARCAPGPRFGAVSPRPGPAGQHRSGWNAAPDTQDDAGSLGPRLLPRKFFLQMLIRETRAIPPRPSSARADPVRRRATPA